MNLGSRLLPKEPYFFQAFVAMTRELRRGAGLLVELLGSQSPRTDLVTAIHDVEHSCDKITREIIQHLNSTFYTPIDREDVYALAKVLDDVMDAVDGAGELIPLHRLEAVRPGGLELARIIAAQADELILATENLPEMNAVMLRVKEIKHLEKKADVVHRDALGRLFDDEKDALEVIKWKDIFDLLEDAADRADKAASLLESIVIKQG
jgi:predicted phosphate transport protein (TIGR00153 family)